MSVVDVRGLSEHCEVVHSYQLATPRAGALQALGSTSNFRSSGGGGGSSGGCLNKG